MTRDWTRNKAIFGKGLSSTERYNLKKGLR